MAKMDSRSKLSIQVGLIKTQKLLNLIKNIDELSDMKESEIKEALDIIQKILDRIDGKVK